MTMISNVIPFRSGLSSSNSCLLALLRHFSSPVSYSAYGLNTKAWPVWFPWSRWKVWGQKTYDDNMFSARCDLPWPGLVVVVVILLLSHPHSSRPSLWLIFLPVFVSSLSTPLWTLRHDHIGNSFSPPPPPNHSFAGRTEKCVKYLFLSHVPIFQVASASSMPITKLDWSKKGQRILTIWEKGHLPLNWYWMYSMWRGMAWHPIGSHYHPTAAWQLDTYVMAGLKLAEIPNKMYKYIWARVKRVSLYFRHQARSMNPSFLESSVL